MNRQAFNTYYASSFDCILVSLYDSCQKLVLEFEDKDGTQLEFSFESHMAVRKTYEADMLKDHEYNEEDLVQVNFGSLVSCLKNSEFLDWLEMESLGIQSKGKYLHYRFVSIDYVVDVISIDCPEMTVLKVADSC